ncbi:energy transducer TonB [Herbaspirillum robiniae]|uniref:TonB C-terminal domain-containing protein n=1 Tax=Herbaspirillum robiniae TaxID=2014887 RepID=A0A246WL43_9BURK|nr:energy transducer TonB [Herbaspirillum robiniae]OWY27050.1 hypothetical protein CEJ42_20700 [Herbaspirillum robiniae]
MRYAILTFAITFIASSAAAQAIPVCSKADETRWQAVTTREVAPTVFYPPQAREEEREGTTRVQFTIDKDGRVSSATILSTSGYRDLDTEAVRAIISKVYPPMVCGGIAQEHTTARSINFHLNPEPAPPAPPLGAAKRATINSILRKLPPNLLPTAYAVQLVDKIPRRLQMEYPSIPPEALKQIVEEVRLQLEAARKNTSEVSESLVQYFNRRYSESELILLEQLVNQPGGETLLKKLSALFQDQRAVVVRWNDSVVERSLSDALGRQKEQTSNAEWLERGK